MTEVPVPSLYNKVFTFYPFDPGLRVFIFNVPADILLFNVFISIQSTFPFESVAKYWFMFPGTSFEIVIFESEHKEFISLVQYLN